MLTQDIGIRCDPLKAGLYLSLLRCLDRAFCDVMEIIVTTAVFYCLFLLNALFTVQNSGTNPVTGFCFKTVSITIILNHDAPQLDRLEYSSLAGLVLHCRTQS